MIFKGFQTLEILVLGLGMLVEPLTELIFIVVVKVLSLSQDLRLIVGLWMEGAMFELLSFFLQVKDLGIELLLALRKTIK